MLFYLMPALCSTDPFALRNLSHIFFVCGGLLLVFAALMLLFLFQRSTRRTVYHWLFVGITLAGSIYACFLAMKTNHDLIVCSFGSTDFFPTFQALSIFVSSITFLLLLSGIGIIILNRRGGISRSTSYRYARRAKEPPSSSDSCFRFSRAKGHLIIIFPDLPHVKTEGVEVADHITLHLRALLHSAVLLGKAGHRNPTFSTCRCYVDAIQDLSARVA